MSAYDLYKPLRNYLRTFHVLDSLAVIRAYMQNLQFNEPIPSAIEVHASYTEASHKAERQVFEWELEVLAKEVILNSPDAGGFARTLRRWDDFAGAINRIKNLENDLFGRYPEVFQQNILLEMYRVAHRQFPWQQPPNSSILLRHFKIFSDVGLEAILQDKLGLTASQLYTLGLAFTGHYVSNFRFDYPPAVSIPGIDLALVERFCNHFSVDLPALRRRVAESQSYDEDYAYTLNPLRMYPLVETSIGGKATLIAPIPTYLFRRFTEGIYYELFDDPRFSAAFGSSFERYVGDILSAIDADNRFSVFPEQEYRVGKDDKRSVDWLIDDDTAALFVECKTKRVRYDAKMALADPAPLNDDLDKMATFIVQAYRAQLDCEQGHYPHWKPAGHRIFPVIVTLEDWYAFGQQIVAQELDKRVAAKLAERGIDPTIAERSPYTICSVSDFEIAIQVMKGSGILDFMSKKTTGEHRLWLVHAFMIDVFRDPYRSARRDLFRDEYQRIYSVLGGARRQALNGEHPVHLGGSHLEC